MGENKITFPIVKGTNVRRNAETGVEIVTRTWDEEGANYEVRRPALSPDGYAVTLVTHTLAEARDQAFEDAYSERQLIEQDHAAAPAVVADPDAQARKQFPSVFAIIDEPSVVAPEPEFVRRAIGTGTVWRNIETGVEIGKFPGQPYVVSVPVNGKHVEVVETVGETSIYTSAHLLAVGTVARMRRVIAAAEREALAMDSDDACDCDGTHAPVDGGHSIACRRRDTLALHNRQTVAEAHAEALAQTVKNDVSMSDADVTIEARRIAALISSEARNGSALVREMLVCARWARTPADALYFAYRAAAEAEIDPFDPPADTALAAMTANFARYEKLRHRPTDTWVRLVGQPRRDPESGWIVISVIMRLGANAETVSVHSLDKD